MVKDIRYKCHICRARHRSRFMISIAQSVELGKGFLVGSSRHICHDCACEYRKIFHGYKNREARKHEKNPLFETFRLGWLEAEQECGLPHMEIPEYMREAYDRLYEETKKKPEITEDTPGAGYWTVLNGKKTWVNFNIISRPDDRISENP